MKKERLIYPLFLMGFGLWAMDMGKWVEENLMGWNLVLSNRKMPRNKH